MVLLASAFDQSKYLKATDFTQEKAVRIKSVTAELVRSGGAQEQKLIAWFTNLEKGLVLNKTNLRTLMGTFGDNTEMWKGKVIVLYPTQTDFSGKLVGALRVRIPPPKQAAAAAGNGQPPKKALDGDVIPPESKPPLKDDLDDEIGF
jgi:hypothetical protein